MSGKEVKWQAMLAGLQTEFPAGSVLMVDGQQYTQAQLVAKLAAWLALFDAAATAKTQATAAVAALHTGLPEGVQFVGALTSALRQLLGVRSPALAGFGIAAPKAPTPATPGQQLVAAAKRAATRKARGIMSAKQRAKIPAAAAPTQVVIGMDGKASVPEPVAPLATPSAGAVVPAVTTPALKS